MKKGDDEVEKPSIRTIAVIADDGAVIEWVTMSPRKNESDENFYKRLSSKERFFGKRYPEMRIQSSTCPDLGAMKWLFPELFRPRTS